LKVGISEGAKSQCCSGGIRHDKSLDVWAPVALQEVHSNQAAILHHFQSVMRYPRPSASC